MPLSESIKNNLVENAENDKDHERSFRIFLIILIPEFIHNFVDRFFNIINSFPCIKKDFLPISSTRPTILPDISSKRSCICFSMFWTKALSSFVEGSSPFLSINFQIIIKIIEQSYQLLFVII